MSKLQKMAIHHEVSCLARSFSQTNFSKINDTENTCKTFQYVFLAFKQWIGTFTKNCRNSKIIGQTQVRRLNKERNKVFQNFANPVCTGYWEPYFQLINLYNQKPYWFWNVLNVLIIPYLFPLTYLCNMQRNKNSNKWRRFYISGQAIYKSKKKKWWTWIMHM